MENISKKKSGPKAKDLTGRKFSLLTVIERVDNQGEKVAWRCICDCGVETTMQAIALTSGHTKSCGCRGKEKAHGFISQMYANYRGAATRRNLNFELKFVEFSDLIKQNCHYCKSLPISKENRADVKRGAFKEIIPINGIDRINSDIGYMTTNCVPCCSICNRAKASMSYTDFITWINRLKSI
jgi:hypothetical protein